MKNLRATTDLIHSNLISLDSLLQETMEANVGPSPPPPPPGPASPPTPPGVVVSRSEKPPPSAKPRSSKGGLLGEIENFKDEGRKLKHVERPMPQAEAKAKVVLHGGVWLVSVTTILYLVISLSVQ